MSESTTTTKRRVVVGMRFQHVYADSNSTWRVTRNMGRGIWEAVIDNPPWTHDGRTFEGEYNGHTDVFRSRDILASVEFSERWAALANEGSDWWETVREGDVLHYCNGFQQFVRCIAVTMTEANTEPGTSGRQDVGMIGMLPVALVGEVRDKAEPGKQGWHRSDIAIRRPDGRVDFGYHARKVINSTGAWRPSTSCIYEAPQVSSNYSGGPDPRTMDAIDLSAPEAADPDSEAMVRHWQAVKDALGDGTPRDGMEALSRLTSARIVLDGGPEFGS